MKSASTLELAEAAPSTQTPPRPAAPAVKPARLPIWAVSPWSYFFSLKVGLVLLLVLTVASVVGTLIDPLERAQAVVYYSWWYKLLLVALALNMSCATWKTLMTKVLPAGKPRFQRVAAFYDGSVPSARVPFDGSVDTVAEAFRRRGFRVAVDGVYGYARRGMASRWGAAISHAGLVSVLLSGFVASWVAREGVVKLMEGGSTRTMWLRTDPPTEHPMGFTLQVDDFDTDYFPKTRIPSHFVSTVSTWVNDQPAYRGPVEVNHSPKIAGWRLHQTSYEEYPQVKRYLLSIAGEGLSEPIEMELSMGQQRLFPGSTDLAIQLANATPLRWRISRAGEPIAAGDMAGEPRGALRLRAEQFEPDFIMGPDRQITSRSQELSNPALKVSVVAENGVVVSTTWLFGREDLRGMGHAASGPYHMDLVKAEAKDGRHVMLVSVTDAQSGAPVGDFPLSVGSEVELGGSAGTATTASVTDPAWTVRVVKPVTAYATVLSLTRNPIIPVIYTGCTLMMLGLMVAFFIRRREVWFWVDGKSGQLRVAAAYKQSLKEFDPSTRAALESLGWKPEKTASA